jgi:hypothetical protein
LPSTWRVGIAKQSLLTMLKHELLTHSQRHISKLILKSLLDNTSDRPESAVLPLVRTHASIVAGSAPNAAMTFMCIPSDPRSTLTNEEWRINTQLRLGLPLASYHNQPHALCPHGCKHPLTKEPVNVRYGYHLVTDCLKANQGKKSHKDVEAAIINHFNIHTYITATKPKPFPGGKQASRHPLLRRHHHRKLCGPELAPRRHVNQPYGGHQPGVHQPGCPWLQAPGPEEHDPRNDVLKTQSARRSASTPSTTPSARQQGRSSHLSRSKRRAGTVPPASS